MPEPEQTEPADPSREHVATVTVSPEGEVRAWAIGGAIPLTFQPNLTPGKYHVLADGSWVQQWGGFGNTGSCTSECTEGHTYRPPCEMSPDLVDPEPLWTLRHIREVLDDPFCPEHLRAKAMRMLATHQELDERPTPSPDPTDVWCPGHQEFHRTYEDCAKAPEPFDPVAILGQLARQAGHRDPEGLMRMARDLLERGGRYADWPHPHGTYDYERDLATGRPLHTDDDGTPMLAPDPEPARGVPHLLVQLAALCAESVNLWYQPNSGQREWQVWTRHPGGTGGAQWGVGDSPYEALADAYQRVVESIFAGRMQP